MKFEANYRAHEGFVQPARKRNQLWRFAFGIIVASAVYLFLNQTLFNVASGFFDQGTQQMIRDIQAAKTPATMYLLLFTFGFMIVGTGVAAKLIHHRSPFGLIGPIPLAFRQFTVVTLAMVTLSVAVLILPPWDYGAPLEPNLDLTVWVLLLPISLIAVLVQVSAEEIVFRGYIQQQLAARFRSPLMW
ncbi:MAG: CPBP family intramembrane glutamate endopeptidase, partial [Sulfitobacter sp.]